MRIPQEVLSRILERIDMLEVIGQYVPLSREGGHFRGFCPFHDDKKTPSFTVTPEKGLFYCFGCNTGGSLFSFLMKIESLSFPESVERLAKKAKVALPVSERAGVKDDSREVFFQLYQQVRLLFSENLEGTREGDRARAYLKSRGFEKSILETYQLGVAHEDYRELYRVLRKKHYSEELLARSGLFSSRYPSVSLFSDRLIFPIHDLQGRIIAFSGRALKEGRGPKYINSPETPIYRKSFSLFGLGSALKEVRRQSSVFLCEGPMDVLALAQVGIGNALAPLGTAFTEEQARLIKRYANTCTLVYDADEAGAKGILRSAIFLEGRAVTPQVASLPEGQDPAALLEGGKTQEIRESLSKSTPFLTWFLSSVRDRYDSSDSDFIVQMTRKVFPYIDSIESPVKKEHALRQIGENFGLSFSAVSQEYRYFKGQGRGHDRGKNQPIETLKDVSRTIPAANNVMSIDLYLLFALVANWEFCRDELKKIDRSELRDGAAVELLDILREIETDTVHELTVLLGERLGSSPLSGLLFSSLSSKEFSLNGKRLVGDALRSVRIRNLRNQSAQVAHLIEISARKGGEGSVEELMREKALIDSRVADLQQI